MILKTGKSIMKLLKILRAIALKKWSSWESINCKRDDAAEICRKLVQVQSIGCSKTIKAMVLWDLRRTFSVNKKNINSSSWCYTIYDFLVIEFLYDSIASLKSELLKKQTVFDLSLKFLQFRVVCPYFVVIFVDVSVYPFLMPLEQHGLM